MTTGLVCVAALCASPALAADMFDAAQAIVADQTDLAPEANLIRLSPAVPMQAAKRIDEAFTTQFGEPKSRRGGVKVWEIDNPAATAGRADTVTIMCGMEETGLSIIIDARAPIEGASVPREQITTAAAPRARARKANNAKRQDNRNRARTRHKIKPGQGDYD